MLLIACLSYLIKFTQIFFVKYYLYSAKFANPSRIRKFANAYFI